MKVINARNVNDALELGLNLISGWGVHTGSRVGHTIEVPGVVGTCYKRPWERVLINELRDANPFFHLMEAMWILAGREDVRFLTEFNKRMVDYSDDGVVFNAAYGYRLRNGNFNDHRDQLAEIITILKRDPDSRQAVAQIWDEDDLTEDTLDKACNMSIVFKVRQGELDITVFNRSNDIIWGAYGTNMVQFSMIQEYVAAKLDVSIGTYTHVSNSFHVYTSGPGGKVYNRLKTYCARDSFNPYHRGIIRLEIIQHCDMTNFEHDLKLLFNSYDDFNLDKVGELTCWKSLYFNNLIAPMISVYLVYKRLGATEALKNTDVIKADDWRKACEIWLTKRIK